MAKRSGNKPKATTLLDTYHISLFDDLGFHVARDGVHWRGKKIGEAEGGAFYESLTQAQAFERLAARAGETATPTIGVVPPSPKGTMLEAAMRPSLRAVKVPGKPMKGGGMRFVARPHEDPLGPGDDSWTGGVKKRTRKGK